MLTAGLFVAEWWLVDEFGWSVHRVAGRTAEGCRALASAACGFGDPYCYHLVAGDDDHSRLARGSPGRVVSRPFHRPGGFRTRRTAPPVRRPGPHGGMARFYRER